ncbi:hypothetical protein [Sphingobacterium sp. IITKGP-BTPF85]|uniref:hypothetical protein n=1 Tax=Sphingobacterium sp. IITKGP-BTPF85 TaxID=1338009 RepID=UPI000389F8E5|nr:hypothetical protein [Sphingobacterium sp. IITKGP-BTPF85]KKX47386.1 hypothetical protein L950_0226795 [Sphingobacterium sp. IITKGP-BTPF85]
MGKLLLSHRSTKYLALFPTWGSQWELVVKDLPVTKVEKNPSKERYFAISAYFADSQ